VKGSVYERRRLGWRDRLRDLVRREKPPSPLVDPPQLVVEQGRPVGYRLVDGSVLRFPEPPSNPAEWPESWWGDGHVDEQWVPLARVVPLPGRCRNPD
jgi:hypothetical protein